MLEVSEVRLDRVVDNLSYASFSMKGWTKSHFQGPFQPGLFYDPVICECITHYIPIQITPFNLSYMKKNKPQNNQTTRKTQKCLNSQAKNSLYKRAEIITNNQLKVFTAGEPSLTEDKSQTSNLPSILSLSRKSLHLFPS